MPAPLAFIASEWPYAGTPAVPEALIAGLCCAAGIIALLLYWRSTG